MFIFVMDAVLELFGGISYTISVSMLSQTIMGS